MMTDDPESSTQTQKTWLERITQALGREPQDREELVEVLRDAEERDLLDADSLAMIEGVLQVSILRVRDVMVPRSQMVVIKESMSLEEIIPIVIDSAHSRFPVIGETLDEVVGILIAKDLLNYGFSEEKIENFDIHAVLRQPVFIPESKRLDVLLREFRASRYHMAMVVDEYGGVAGLVTIEDVLEQIVGDIEDEHDYEEELNIKKHSEKEYIVKALTPIEEFNAYFHDNLSEEAYDTIGGLVLHQFGHLPKRGEEVSFGRYDFKVLSADKRRLQLLKVVKF